MHVRRRILERLKIEMTSGLQVDRVWDVNSPPELVVDRRLYLMGGAAV